MGALQGVLRRDFLWGDMGKLRVATRRALAERGDALLPALCESIASGNNLTQAAKEQGMVVGVLLAWIDALPERRAAVDAAYKQFAEAKVSETIPIADGAEKDEAQIAKLRIETRLNVAALYDPDRYGKKTQSTVTNNTVVLGDSTVKAASELLKRLKGDSAKVIDVTPLDTLKDGEKIAYG